MQRSVGLCLVQPMAYSWLQNSRVACCCYQGTAAHLPVGAAAGQGNSTTLTTAGDSSPSCEQQQREVSSLSRHNTAHPHCKPWRRLPFPGPHEERRLCSSQRLDSCQQQQQLCRLPVLQQPLQMAGFSTSSSCKQPYRSYSFQQLHGIHPGQQPFGGASSQSGSANQQAQQQQQPILGEVTVHPLPYEGHQEGNGSSGFKPRSFRRREPQFQVIEFPADGLATESFIPRTAQELGLHPRDVTLFAPLSRLAAPQRATIAVHDGKILVKTEIVKAIITADKATLIKGRRQHDTQKLAQSILAANDARLKAIQLSKHQTEQLTSSIVPGLDGSMMGSCERAASAADLIRAAADKSAYGRSSMRQVVTASGGTYRPGDQVRGPGRGGDPAGFGARLQPGGVAAGQQMLAQAAGSELKDVPFEMLVLEVLLDATAEYFYTKVQHLNWMLESIAADIRQGNQPWQGGAIDKAHQLIPIQKFMTSLKNDVRETCDALKAVLADDETLQDLCLSWHIQQRQHTRWTPVELQKHNAGRWSETNSVRSNGNGNGNGNGSSAGKALTPEVQVRLLTEMLESYEREIQSLEGSINEAEEDLDNTRSIWHMQLDSSRNHIIMVNLWLSIVNISVMGTTILPAFFGMNLSSGLSDTDPFFFYMICSCSMVLAVGSYPVARFWFFRNWKKANQSQQFEQKVLRVLLVQHIEDVGQIITALREARYKHLNRKGFRSLMYETLGNRAMSATNIDFLWEAFDRDRDGFLAEAEHLLPIHNYQGNGNGSNGGDSSKGTPQHPADAAPLHPAAGLMPSQLGSLDGLPGRGLAQGAHDIWPGSPGGESLAQWQGRSLINAVRATPYQQHKQQQHYEQEYGQPSQQQQQPPSTQQQQPQKGRKEEEKSWADDDRFSWD